MGPPIPIVHVTVISHVTINRTLSLQALCVHSCEFVVKAQFFVIPYLCSADKTNGRRHFTARAKQTAKATKARNAEMDWNYV
jgi:hypothetical protein